MTNQSAPSTLSIVLVYINNNHYILHGWIVLFAHTGWSARKGLASTIRIWATEETKSLIKTKNLRPIFRMLTEVNHLFCSFVVFTKTIIHLWLKVMNTTLHFGKELLITSLRVQKLVINHRKPNYYLDSVPAQLKSNFRRSPWWLNHVKFLK